MKLLKNNFVVRFVVTLFIVGLIVGVLLYFTYKPDLNDYIETFVTSITTSHNNTFLMNLALISGIFILSLIVIGLPVILFYIFYEGLSIGFTLITFISLFGIKGATFYILYFLVIKAFYIVIMFYFSVISIRFIYKFISAIAHKNKEVLYKTITYQLLRYIIVVTIILLNSAVIYFFSNRIITLFINLIK